MKVSGLKAMIQNRWNRDGVYCTAEYWDSKAGEYRDEAVSGWPNRSLSVMFDERELALYNACFPNVSGMKILDIGCGTGRISRYFAVRGAEVTGIDFSEKAIALAREQSASENPAYRVQTIFQLKDENHFDIALSLGCLSVACQNRDQLATSLQRAFAALKPGGKMLLFELFHSGPLHLVLNMSLKEVKEVVQDAGFAIEKVSGLHFWPVVRTFGHFNWPGAITKGAYRMGELLLAATGGVYFADYKAILAARPATSKTAPF